MAARKASFIRTLRILLLAPLLSGSLAAVAQQRTPQVTEPSAIAHAIDPAAAPLESCEPGARWIRVGFSALVLAPGDSLTLLSSQGDRLVFADGRWNGRQFHARALRGDCVQLQPAFAGVDSSYLVDGYDAGTLPLQESTATVAGAGDLCDDTPDDCAETADLVVDIVPDAVFTTGDNAYGSGTLAQFNTYYDPNWGRFKALTFPVPGNHDYVTAGAAGYFDYFNGVGQTTGPAGDRSKGYYSYDVGEWHFIALNSRTGGTVSSTQLAWLQADLAANTKPCTAAYFHYPLLSRGRYSGYATMKPYFDRLYAAKADLVIVGHDHNYQRYARMDSFKVGTTDGVRQLVVGTGGGDGYALVGTHPLLEAAQSGTWGVARLDLTPIGYTGAFVPIAGKTWTDQFSATCNNAMASTPDLLASDFDVSVASSPLTLVRGGSVTQAITVRSSGDFSAPVKLTVSGLPSGTRYTFAPSSPAPPIDGSVQSLLTLRAVSTQWTGTLTIKVKGTAAGKLRTTTFRLTLK